MPADLHASAYLVDGVALAASTVALTHDGAGLFAGYGEEVGVLTSPGADGGIIAGGSFRPYTLATMYLVQGSGFDDVWEKIVALRRRCKVGRSVTLTRTIPDPDGTDANVSHTTTARRQADRVEWLTGSVALVDIDWLITDLWHGAPVTVAASGTPTILGDTRTRRMVVTLPAGPARYVSNNTNGHWLLFYAVVPSGGVEIDVEALTATAVTGSVDMSQHLSWAKTYPLQLEAGPNDLAVTDGTASIDYQPAYL